MKHYALLMLFLALCSRVQAQPLNGGITDLHGAGCDNQSGRLKVVPYGGNGAGTYTYLWSTGSTDQIVDSVPAGEYWVIVYSGQDSVLIDYTLPPFGVVDLSFHHVCSSEPGFISLGVVQGEYPIHYEWYLDTVLLADDTYSLNDLEAGTYRYVLTDDDGCIDSGSVTLIESIQHMDIFLEDSSLCYWDSTRVWYTPGFTVWYNGEEHSTATDTLLYINQSFYENIPLVGIDSLGCESEPVWPGPFIYRQNYPYVYPQPPLYLIDDTLSVFMIIDTEQSICCTYNWVRNGTLEVSWPFTYLPVDSGGYYEVFSINEYGCYAPCGHLAVSLAGMEDQEQGLFELYPNPVEAGGLCQLVLADEAEQLPYTIVDHSGKIAASGYAQGSTTFVKAPNDAGMYFLRLGSRSSKLVVIE